MLGLFWQISGSEFDNAGKNESDCEEDYEEDSQSIARNYVENCAADSNEEFK
jgi:hypothetical protein